MESTTQPQHKVSRDDATRAVATLTRKVGRTPGIKPGQWAVEWEGQGGRVIEVCESGGVRYPFGYAWRSYADLYSVAWFAIEALWEAEACRDEEAETQPKRAGRE